MLAEVDVTIERRMAEARGAPPKGQDTLGAPATHNRSDAARMRTTPAELSEPLKPSYTQRLLADRNLRLKKIGEEAAELVTACADGDRARAAEEVADLFYHALVALRAVGGGLADVRQALAARRGDGR